MSHCCPKCRMIRGPDKVRKFFSPETKADAAVRPVAVDCYTAEGWEYHVTDYFFQCQKCFEFSIGRLRDYPGREELYLLCVKCDYHQLVKDKEICGEFYGRPAPLRAFWEKCKSVLRKALEAIGPNSRP